MAPTPGLTMVRRDRREGDAARDLGDWAGAERHYRQHLARKPTDAAIWVQLGHAQKELDHLEDAEASYRKAIE
ncbi:MAG TPA: tetratricopeptide repeat protein, partial [Caulobacteraceae bacterium]